MVRFTVLASGSKGNSTVVCGGRTRILVDAGLSCRELFRRMKLADEAPEALDAIVITHEHQDHVNGLAVTARKLGIPVYFTEATHRAWTRWLTPRRQMTYKQWLELCRKQAAERQAEPEAPALDAATEESEFEDAGPEEAEVECLVQAGAASQPADIDPGLAAEPALAHSFPAEPASGEPASAGQSSLEPPTLKEDPTWLPAVEYFRAGVPFSIGDIALSPFTIPHDAADPVGFVLSSEGVRMGFATDLGYIPPNVRQQLQDLDLLLLESNHDLEMLRDGPYPWSVKQRVLSRVGHLSNDATAEFLSSAYDGQAAYVILAHLSENNNLPELARVAAERALLGRASLLANRLLLAEQHQPLSAIRF
ncbi:MAG: MBL fold metallo-hydrolase [Terracidiphilus sp.]|jgi:phosphoribosyl 1,2-cyclic phosphodiesterase